MALRLVVVRPFAGHRVGDVITDPAQIAAILAGEQASRVVKVAVPVTPAASSFTPAAEQNATLATPQQKGN